jgi:hypothetical protein
MSLHYDLPIYKKGRELLQLAYLVQLRMPRAFKRTLGEKITVHCTEMLDLMAMANATRGAERAGYIRELLARQRTSTVLLRVCFDMELISHKLWADSVQVLGTIGKQGGGWLKSVNPQPAPAA